MAPPKGSPAPSPRFHPAPPGPAGRSVPLKGEKRGAALAVGSVWGVRPLDRAALSAPPPLPSDEGSAMLAAMLDRDFFLALKVMRVVPAETSLSPAGPGRP